MVNTETGQEIIEALSDLEAAQIDANLKESKRELAQAKVKADAKAIEKAALLNRLGITEEEAKLLLS
jgi:ribosomal protein L29